MVGLEPFISSPDCLYKTEGMHVSYTPRLTGLVLKHSLDRVSS